MSATSELVPRRRGRAAIEHPVSAVLAGGVLFGTAGVAQGLADLDASPISVGAVRLAGGALALTAYLSLRGVSPLHLLRLWGAKATLIAGLGAGLYQPFFFAGIGYAGVPIATLVAVGSGPLLTGALAWLLSRERPKRTWFIATTVCVVGLIVLTGSGGGGNALIGAALALGAGASSALYNVMAKRLLARGVPLLEILASTFLFGSVVVLPAAFWFGLGWLGTWQGAALAAYLGLATMALANFLFTRGLGGLPAATAATLVLVDPLTATVLGAVLLGQVLSPLGWVGLGVLFVGLVLQGVWARRDSPS